MNEAFLSFVWRYQQFDTSHLVTTSNEHLTILKTGFLNRDAGPDFSEARIILDGLEWIGHVEIHVYSSEWMLHGHQRNPSYRNVILHVVWEDDLPIKAEDGTRIPTLCLRSRIGRDVHQRHLNFMAGYDQLFPCRAQFEEVEEIIKLNMMAGTGLERLNKKADQVISLWQSNARDWEETSYQLSAKYFGFKLNASCFAELARLLPLRMLQKHGNSLFQIEALLFGTAGLLSMDPKDDYSLSLQQEYNFLKAKLRLVDVHLNGFEWKFMRTRPSGFPTIRIAQFATFIFLHKNVFSAIINTKSVAGLRKLFMIVQSDYWRNHHRFGGAVAAVPVLGKSSADALIINVAVPLSFAYARLHGIQEEIDRVIGWLEELPPENNRVVRTWKAMGVKARQAFESQALLEWQSQYCEAKRCLDCAVGYRLICGKKGA